MLLKGLIRVEVQRVISVLRNKSWIGEGGDSLLRSCLHLMHSSSRGRAGDQEKGRTLRIFESTKNKELEVLKTLITIVFNTHGTKFNVNVELIM